MLCAGALPGGGSRGGVGAGVPPAFRPDGSIAGRLCHLAVRLRGWSQLGCEEQVWGVNLALAPGGRWAGAFSFLWDDPYFHGFDASAAEGGACSFDLWAIIHLITGGKSLG